MCCIKSFQSGLTCGETSGILYCRRTCQQRSRRIMRVQSVAPGGGVAGGILQDIKILSDIPLQLRNGSLDLLESILRPFDFFSGNYFLEFLTVVNFLFFSYIFVVLMPRK